MALPDTRLCARNRYQNVCFKYGGQYNTWTAIIFDKPPLEDSRQWSEYAVNHLIEGFVAPSEPKRVSVRVKLCVCAYVCACVYACVHACVLVEVG